MQTKNADRLKKKRENSKTVDNNQRHDQSTGPDLTFFTLNYRDKSINMGKISLLIITIESCTIEPDT